MATLITGAAGFIGSVLTDRLLAAGERVVGLDSFHDFYARDVKEANLASARDHDGFTLVEGDLRDEDAWARMPDGVEVVVHLAALAGVRPSIENPRAYASVNVDGTVAVLEWMRTRELQHLLFASSSSVYGNNRKVPFAEADAVDAPISPYAATKRAGELICETYQHLYGVRGFALRFFTAYGPRQRPDLAIHKFTRLLSEGRPIPMFGDGTTARDYTFIEDIVEGVVRARNKALEGSTPFRIVNLGCGRPTVLSEMIEVLADEMGVEARIDRLPMQPGDVERTYADIGVANELLGYTPTTELRAGIRSFLAWFDSGR